MRADPLTSTFGRIGRGAIATVLMGMILLTAAGCLSLARPAPKIVRYALETTRPAGASTPAATPGILLKLRPLRMAQMFDDRKFVYRRESSRWESDFYREFFIAPGQMISSITSDWLQKSGVAGQVVPASSQLSPTHVLEGTIHELYGDWSQPASPRAVVAIEFILIDQRSVKEDDARIVLHRTYRHETPVAGTDPQALVAGWNGSVAAILKNFETDLRAVHWQAAAGPVGQ